jgi:V/A-type H+-transporting ATPase subunit I
LWGIYFLVASIVIQGFPQPAFTIPLLGVSILLVVLFTIGKGEFKSNGIDLAMLPLSFFGAMGDIISYLRLFAVGLASVQVAQNFNLMAVGLTLPIYLKIPALLVILLLAHVVNLAMGGLSVLVHAVRLNTLEFSNAKGISWAGFAYRPFVKKSVKKETP